MQLDEWNQGSTAPKSKLMTSQASNQIAQTVRTEYGALAHSYERRWRRYLEASIAHTLAALEPNGRECILDAGCGTGLLLQRIAECASGARLIGIDLTLAMLRQAGSAKSDLVLGDVCHLPFAGASLDAVVMASVLQYLFGLDAALAETARVLRPGGRLVITSWDGNSRRVQMLARWLRWRDHADVHLHSLSDVIAACRDHGLRVRQDQRYSAGHMWRLMTIMAVKAVDDRDAGSMRDPTPELPFPVEAGDQAPVARRPSASIAGERTE